MKLQLTKVTEREGDVREFAFQPPQPLDWTAGQYMHYVLPHDADDRGDERWFTISSAPSEGEVRITTRINHEHSSSFKEKLQALEIGDEIEADGPEGDFVIEDPSRNILFVAGGIGITPIRSMLVEAQTQGQQLNATLLYSNRNENIPFRDELNSLQTQNPNLKIEYIVSPDRIDADRILQAAEAIDSPLIYISGPKPMVKDLARQLKDAGADKQSLKTDDFPGYEGI